MGPLVIALIAGALVLVVVVVAAVVVVTGGSTATPTPVVDASARITDTFSVPSDEWPLVELTSSDSIRGAFTVEVEDGVVIVKGNDIPNYQPTLAGVPIVGEWSDMLGDLEFEDTNPSGLEVQELEVHIPVQIGTETPTATGLGTIGVAVNGVRLFNPFAGMDNTDAITVEVFGSCCGHPNDIEGYHLHLIPACGRIWGLDLPSNERAAYYNTHETTLVGWLIDGVPVSGPRGPDGLYRSSYTGPDDADGNPTYVEGSGNLDEYNGITDIVQGYNDGEAAYHYCATIKVDEAGDAVTGINYNFAYDLRYVFADVWDAPEDNAAYLAAMRDGFTATIAEVAVAVPGISSYTTGTAPDPGVPIMGNPESVYANFLSGTALLSSELRDRLMTVIPAYPYFTSLYRYEPLEQPDQGDDGGGPPGPPP